MAANSLYNLSIFREPQCLIDTKDGKLRVQSSVITELKALAKGLVIIAIAGLCRTGKSYFMNRLARKRRGFTLSPTVQTKTKGIWIWVREHPTHDDRYLVLLDTEGLGDTEKGDKNHDNWIFALATLLSSTLVYNAIETINEDDLAKLNFMIEMLKLIRTKSSGADGDDADFDCFFPLFIFVLRDFSQENIVIDGIEVTSDQYLEHLLTLRSKRETNLARSRKSSTRNIGKYFKNRKCFTRDRPTAERHQLRDLETLSDSELSPDFVKEETEFLNFVYANCPVKKLNGTEINGRMLSAIVTSYVGAICNGVMPCVESATRSLALTENSTVLNEALHVYIAEMETGLTLPTINDKILNDHHFRSIRKAIKYFIDKAVMDENNQFQKELNMRIEERFGYFIKANSEASFNKCKASLVDLESKLASKLKDGGYAKAGGFIEFQRDLQDVHRKYNALNDLGVMKNEALLAYMLEKQNDSDTVIATDQKMTAEEKSTEAERQRAFESELRKQSAEREAELTRQYETALQDIKENLEESNATWLAKMEAYYAKITDDRINEQKRLLEEVFKRESDQLRTEIGRLASMQQSGGGRFCTIL